MKIVTAPSEVLKQKASVVEPHELADIKSLLPEFYRTMKREGGIGLAAPQVGISKRFLAIEIEGNEHGCVFMINPVITQRSDSTIRDTEACLSIPGGFGPVVRNETVVVEFLNMDGDREIIETGGLLARAIQHEIDHLDGILYIDHMNLYHRNKVMDKVRKKALRG